MIATDQQATALRKRMEQRVQRFLAEEASLAHAGRVVVGVSGGRDSTALLLILARLRRRLGLELTAAYFDHRLRGEAAAAAEGAAAARLAREAGVALVTGAGDVKQAARREHRSLEDAARRARYAFLATTAAAVGATHVSVGHTASDQAETVLLHIVRGAGLRGLAGMAAAGAWPLGAGPALLRPLLCLSRDETLAYCRAAGLEPLEDASNLSPDFERNRLRHEVLPLLRELNPGVEAALAALAASVRPDADLIEALAGGLLRPDHEGIALSRARLAAAHPALRAHALRLALASAAGESGGFAAAHVAALGRLVLRGHSGDSLDLPRGLTATLSRQRLELRRGKPDGPELPEQPVCLDVPGTARFGPFRVQAGASALPASTSVEADAAAVGRHLAVRRPRPGDRMQPAGMQGTKKLQDIFVDEHVARPRRAHTPVFENGRGIVWLSGLRLAGWARPRAGEPAVTLSFAPD